MFFDQKANQYNVFQPSCHGSPEKSHGRIETRTVTIKAGIDWLRERRPWAGLASIVLVESCREIEAGTECESRVDITPLPASARRIALAIRGHRGIETGLHRVMDMVFRDDECRIRAGQLRGRQAHGKQPAAAGNRQGQPARQTRTGRLTTIIWHTSSPENDGHPFPLRAEAPDGFDQGCVTSGGSAGMTSDPRPSRSIGAVNSPMAWRLATPPVADVAREHHMHRRQVVSDPLDAEHELPGDPATLPVHVEGAQGAVESAVDAEIPRAGDCSAVPHVKVRDIAAGDFGVSEAGRSPGVAFPRIPPCFAPMRFATTAVGMVRSSTTKKRIGCPTVSSPTANTRMT